MSPIVSDAPLAHFRRTLAKLIDAERTAPAHEKEIRTEPANAEVRHHAALPPA